MKSISCLLLLVALASAAQTLNSYVNDNHVLNYALTLENFEAALYEAGVSKFNASAYTAAGYPSGVAEVVSLISKQERSHANSLTSLLRGRGWPAVPSCTYDFSTALVDVSTFLDTLLQVEMAGVSAYDFGAQAITNKDLLQLAAGIATVEARHVSILAQIVVPENATVGSSFPANATTPIDPASTFDAVKSFNYIQSCPTNSSFVSYVNRTVSVSSTNTSTYLDLIKTALALRTNVTSATTFYYNNATIRASDAVLANYALTLEHLEATFYSNFSDHYSVEELSAIGVKNATLVSESIALIAQHEQNHVAFLTAFINGLPGATPVSQCASYNWTALGVIINAADFGPENINGTTFLQAAYALESTGVGAYVGAINSITNSAIATVAATIATVEAEHAAYISYLINGLPTESRNTAFPDIVDGALSPSSVVSQISKILPSGDSCVPSSLPNQRADLFGDALGPSDGPFGGSSSSSSSSSQNGSAATITFSVAVVASVVALLL